MTRSSSVSPTAAIPGWVDLGALDASFPHGYGRPVPAGAVPALRAAAEAHRAALVPSTADERHAVLMGLRSGTLIRDEDEREAMATFKLLRSHLDDVPLDILQDACRAYCNAPGRRYFPKSAGELRTFIAPLIHQRAARALRLRKLAEQCEREEARAAELAADPLTVESMREILAQHGIGNKMAALITPGRDQQQAA